MYDAPTSSHPPAAWGQTRYLLIAIWLCFLARGMFYASLLPLWEGYDEWSHFAFVQNLAEQGRLPENQTPVSDEVQRSLELAPLPWTLRSYAPPSLTHDAFWKLPPEERSRRVRELAEVPWTGARTPADHGQTIYEAQQPPLYYWLMQWPLRLMRTLPLTDRVFALRWISVLIASLYIPIAFLVGRAVFQDERLALAAVALSALLPELLINVARVSNESLALVMYTLLLLVTLRFVRQHGGIRLGAVVGVVLGFGLLTKTYFLTAIPALGLIVLDRFLEERNQARAIIADGVVAALIGITFPARWFWRNHELTGTWTGLQEDVALPKTPLTERLSHIPQVDWRNAAGSIIGSHVWFGAWSFLQVRSWMIHLFTYLALVALCGLVYYFWRSRRAAHPARGLNPDKTAILVLASFYGFFWLGLGYHVLAIFLADGQSTSTGWYLYCLVTAEVLLMSCGLLAISPAKLRPWVIPGGALLAALLDLYTVHFLLIPYYTGLISHRPNGALGSFHLGQLRAIGFHELLNRLAVNKPPLLSGWLMLFLWLLYLAATGALVLLACAPSEPRP